MINETIANNTAVVSSVNILAEGFVRLLETNNMWILFFAFIGGVSLIAAIAKKVFQAGTYLFYAFIIIPVIVVIGFINKRERSKRFKQLGEIKAHLKENPEKWKGIAIYTIISICVLSIAFFITFGLKYIIN